VVQVYNTAEALPNLINPFWMLPLLGVRGLKARDIVGFTFLQLLVTFPHGVTHRRKSSGARQTKREPR
jgi:short subunit fatty acids transporter